MYRNAYQNRKGGEAMRRSYTILCCLAMVLGIVACDAGTTPGEQKQAFQAPILDDPTDLEQTVDLKGHVDFGANEVGHFSNTRPLIGYLVDALRGARLTLELQASQDSSDDPVLVLYGPADGSGIFGEKIAMDDDGRDGRNSLIDGLALPADGTYLILVTSYSGRDEGEYKLSVGCHGNCGEPVCPDILCDLYCPNGFMTDENGCPICRCKEDPEYCRSDRDCPDGFFCNPCPMPIDCEEGGPCPMDGEDRDGDGNADSDPGMDMPCGPPRCEPIHNDYCESDADCPPGFACELRWDDVDPLCDETDAAGNEAGDPERPCYEPPRGVCVPRQHECFSDDDCPPGHHCELPFLDAEDVNCHPQDDGTRPDDCIPPGGVCMPDELACESNEDCPPGMVCEWFRDGTTTDPETGEGCYPGERCGWDHGICVPAGCNCPEIWAPVCAVTPWGEELTFANACEAECEGARIVHEGECGGNHHECFSDADCPAGFRCELPMWDDRNCFDDSGNMDENCIPGDCVLEDGTVDPDCMPQGPGICVPVEIQCMVDSDCPPGYACELLDFGGGQDIDGDGQVDCDPATGTDCMPFGICVPRQQGCLSDADCAPGERCELIDCADADGEDNTDPDGNGTDCAPYGICVPVNEGCLSDADCPAGFRCELNYFPDGTCDESTGEDCDNVPPCDPATGEYCGEPFGRCVPVQQDCIDDSDCPDGFFCLVTCYDENGDGQIPPDCFGTCQPREDNRCIVTGCSGQVCAPHPVNTDCEWRPEYECLQFSECMVLDDTASGELGCGWLETPEYLECLARIQGCRSDDECGPGEFCLDGQCQGEDCVCPEIYAPVCGLLLASDGQALEQTFGNLCELRCAGAELLHEGECDNGDDDLRCNSDNECPDGSACINGRCGG